MFFLSNEKMNLLMLKHFKRHEKHEIYRNSLLFLKRKTEKANNKYCFSCKTKRFVYSIFHFYG